MQAMSEPDVTYEYKPALMGAPWQFQLRRDAMDWSVGRHSGRVPYDAIARVRLSFRPLSMQTYRFLAEIWPVEGPKLTIASTSWRNIAGHERQDAGYVAFVRELHRRIAEAGGRGTFISGSPPFLYWPGVAIFGAASLALAVLIIRALQAEGWGGAAIVLAFLLLLAWQVGGFFRRNRPGRYRPDALPPDLLPRG
jgi:hypothetical protein